MNPRAGAVRPYMKGTRAFAMGLLLTAASASGEVTRGPYTQSVDQDSAVIGLRLDAPCPALVRYGEGDALDSIARSAGSATQHFIELDGLKAGTEYHFSVEACDTPTGESGSFRTASDPGEVRVHFAAVGDMGTGGAEQRAIGQAMATSRPEFWLALGDNASPDGTDAEFGSNFFTPLADLLRISPVFTVPGNLEYHSDEAQPYLEAFELPRNNPGGTERYYSFDWGPLHVVALDSNGPLQEQKAWLETDLAASKAPWKLVMVHYPPYSTGSDGSSTRLRELGPIFEKHGVDLVLSAHDHDYERTKPLVRDQPVAPGTPGAVTYIVVGTGGAGLRDWGAEAANWTEVRDNAEFGYLDIQIDGGALVAQFVTPEGEILDTFTKDKKVPEAPELSMNIEPAAGTAPLQSHFKLSGNDGAMIAWSFGDGGNQLGTDAEVTHTYQQPGVYTATAVVQDILGEPYYATRSVTVMDAEGNPGPVVQPPPPVEPPGASPAGKIGCTSAGLGLLGFPLAMFLLAIIRRQP